MRHGGDRNDRISPEKRGPEKMRAVRTRRCRTFQGLPKAKASVQAMHEVPSARVKARSSEVESECNLSERRRNVPEFHPGPKGKSHEKTVLMMGDCAASSSSLSALSCCTGAHAWISAFWWNVESQLKWYVIEIERGKR